MINLIQCKSLERKLYQKREKGLTRDLEQYGSLVYNVKCNVFLSFYVFKHNNY